MTDKIKVTLDPVVASRYATTGERIIEFSHPTRGGGLISIRVDDDGGLIVEPYRCDDTVEVRTSSARTVRGDVRRLRDRHPTLPWDVFEAGAGAIHEVGRHAYWVAILRRAERHLAERGDGAPWAIDDEDPTPNRVLPEVPEDFPVKVLGPDDPATERATCGTCLRSWDDAVATSYTPTPAARCPFEPFH